MMIETEGGLMLKFERRQVRLERRAEIWEGGLTPVGRAHAWFDLLFFDHGILRLCYRNRHLVTQGLWRSAQPTPGDLKTLKEKGLKSVICVRGGRAFGSWPLEKEACERLQLDLHKIGIRARQAPRKQDLLELIDLLGSLTYPALIHCKSGADRTGFVAAVYLIAIARRPVDEGLGQLALRFGHLRSSRAGVLREVIEAFRRDGAAAGLDFRSWVETSYEPDEVAHSFRPRPLSAVTDLLLRREG
jgi:protein tyrosine phosphatase (PTP) superfamily phosphohydrolase (DUF442 family)